MNEELNIYDVVRYFVKMSGMLFFYTKEDVKIAYDRISTILNCEKQYIDRDVTKEIKKLKGFYDYFIENFDDYILDDKNKELFDDIMKLDSNIIFCGSELSLNYYIKNARNYLKEANSALMFFQKRYAVREGMRKIDGVFKRINEYKSFYNLNFEYSQIDNILNYLGLGPLAKEEEIVDAYNNMLFAEYEMIVNNDEVDMKKLKNSSKKMSYIRDVITCFYSVGEKLEKRTLVDIYSKPLSSESEYYDAINFFKLNPNCTKEQVVEKVEKFIDDIINMELVNSISIGGGGSYGGVPFVDGKVNDDRVLESAEYYKNILYNYYGIEISEEEESILDEEIVSNNNEEKEYSEIFSDLFHGLDYFEARKLYFSLMNSFLSADSKVNDSKIRELDNYWNSVEEELKRMTAGVTKSGNIKK